SISSNEECKTGSHYYTTPGSAYLRADLKPRTGNDATLFATARQQQAQFDTSSRQEEKTGDELARSLMEPDITSAKPATSVKDILSYWADEECRVPPITSTFADSQSQSFRTSGNLDTNSITAHNLASHLHAYNSTSAFFDDPPPTWGSIISRRSTTEPPSIPTSITRSSHSVSMDQKYDVDRPSSRITNQNSLYANNNTGSSSFSEDPFWENDSSYRSTAAPISVSASISTPKSSHRTVPMDQPHDVHFCHYNPALGSYNMVGAHRTLLKDYPVLSLHVEIVESAREKMTQMIKSKKCEKGTSSSGLRRVRRLSTSSSASSHFSTTSRPSVALQAPVTVDISHLNFPAFKAMITYIYTHDIESILADVNTVAATPPPPPTPPLRGLSEERTKPAGSPEAETLQIGELLLLAHQFDIQELVKDCARLIQSYLSVENAIPTLVRLGSEYEEIKKPVMSFIKKNFAKIFGREDEVDPFLQFRHDDEYHECSVNLMAEILRMIAMNREEIGDTASRRETKTFQSEPVGHRSSSRATAPAVETEPIVDAEPRAGAEPGIDTQQVVSTESSSQDEITSPFIIY
ncbi:hypothetical protein BX616_006519, partial [Lobosporangium transversale]